MSKNPQVLLKNRYQVVPRTLILLFSQDKVLLQKGSIDKKIYPGFYNGLGGHIEKGEDVLSSARRELIEESGLECPDLNLCGVINIEVEDSNGILLFVFTGKHVIGEMLPSEEGKLYWIEESQISNYDVVDDIPELISRIKERKKNGEIFYANYSYDEEGRRFTTLAK